MTQNSSAYNNNEILDFKEELLEVLAVSERVESALP